jgi:hypothetical protein
MFLKFPAVWVNPLRRIYLIWGIVLLVGFIISGLGYFEGFLHWYVLSLVGIGGQLYKQRLTAWQAKLFLGMWAIIALIGTYISHQVILGNLLLPDFLLDFSAFWLYVLSIPQLITAFILQKKFQIGLGISWLIGGILCTLQVISPAYSLFFVALITGVPYLLIAFKKTI